MTVYKGSHLLPFVKYDGAKIVSYWSPQPETGHWGKDNRIGRDYADDLYYHCPAQEVSIVLRRITEEIARSGRHEGIEVGFFTRLGEHVVDARARVEQSVKA